MSNIERSLRIGALIHASTNSKALVTGSAGELTESGTTAAQIGYLSTLSSDVQTQINTKQATITGAASTIVSSDLTASVALISTAGGKVGVSAVTSAELAYVGGVTSAIQTQLNAKLTTALTSAHLFVGDGSNVATDTAITGDVTISNGGVTAIGTQKVTHTMLALDIEQVVTVTLTAAQFKNINASPFQLIAAPGAGFAVIPLRAEIQIVGDGTAAVYIYASALDVRPTNISGTLALSWATSGLPSVSNVLSAPRQQQGVTTSYNEVDNAAFFLTSGTSPTIGDSSVKVRIYYKVVTTTL